MWYNEPQVSRLEYRLYTFILFIAVVVQQWNEIFETYLYSAQ